MSGNVYCFNVPSITYKDQTLDVFLQSQVFLFVFEILLLQVEKVIVRHRHCKPGNYKINLMREDAPKPDSVKNYSDYFLVCFVCILSVDGVDR